eukprot:3959659-Pleurochrysis_carterae.AAC.3
MALRGGDEPLLSSGFAADAAAPVSPPDAAKGAAGASRRCEVCAPAPLSLSSAPLASRSTTHAGSGAETSASAGSSEVLSVPPRQRHLCRWQQ